MSADRPAARPGDQGDGRAGGASSDPSCEEHALMSTAPREIDPTSVTFCLWWSGNAPPQVVGRTAEDAERRLLAHLTRMFAEEAEPSPGDPTARARQELGTACAWGLSLHCAPDERSAWEVWHQVSMLTPAEALRRWRMAFPVEGSDPLAAVVEDFGRLGVRRRGAGGASGPVPAPQEDYALLNTLAERLGRHGSEGTPLPR